MKIFHSLKLFGKVYGNTFENWHTTHEVKNTSEKIERMIEELLFINTCDCNGIFVYFQHIKYRFPIKYLHDLNLAILAKY